MSLSFTRTNFITGSYSGDALFLLEVAENNPLRLTSNPSAPVSVQTDSVGRAFIGYGYDLAANAATAVSDLLAAGAVISNVAALQAAINALPVQGKATAAEISAVSALVYLPNAASAALLLQNALATRETAFNTILGSIGLPVEPGSEERAALMDMWYQTPAYFEKPIRNANGVVTGYSPTNLTVALLNGNRAEAWYQIRYGSSANGSQGTGIVSRRYVDAQLFGLFANPNSPTTQEVLQAYEMLTTHRSTIFSYESRFGTDPDSATVNPSQPTGLILAANKTYGLNSSSAVQTLSATFAPAVDTFLSSYVRNASPLLTTLQDSFVRSTDIYVASSSDPNVTAGNGDSISTGGLAQAYDNHILVGTGGGESLTGGLGDDILIAGSGSETLTSGLGSDTIIAGGGVDTINLRATSATVDFEFQGQTGLAETINAGAFNFGGIDVGGQQLTGSTEAPAKSFVSPNNSYDLTWTDSSGDSYIYNEAADSLSITGGALGSGAAGNTIVINNFNLSAAQNGGFLGISLAPYGSIVFSANAGSDPPTTNFMQGSTQSYTLGIDAPSPSAQTVTITLTGANSSDFAAMVGTAVEQLNSNGSFTVTLPAGETSVSFSLIDQTADNGQSDIAGGATLTLSASIPDTSNPGGAAIQAGSLTFNYVPTSWDTDGETPPADVITGVPQSDGSGITVYTGDGNSDSISTSGSLNLVSTQNSGNDSIVGSSGTNTIFGGNGNDIIVGNSGTDIIIDGNGNSEIYAGSKTAIPNAVADTSSGGATGQQGDLIAVGNGDNTIVGGNGSDLITAGSGSDLIFMGPGADTFEGGVLVSDAVSDWSTSITPPFGTQGFELGFNGISDQPGAYTGSFSQPYNGTSIDGTNTPLGAANDTIYGSTGNEYIDLGNGNNDVEMGSGTDTVLGGMGNDTLIAGSGADNIRGGGGTTYIEGGSGNDTLVGGDGNNTIIGGSGNSTIYSANGPSGGTAFANASLEQNYVDGGSGNDVIYGSGGNDTLIAGSGNTTVYGGLGSEDITGGTGNDLLVGGTGNDTLTAGGSGNDTLQALGSASSTAEVYGGDGQDSITGGSGSNTLYAGDGGTAGAATFVTASQSDATASTTIYGGLGVDLLEGGAGSAVIYAGDGGTSVAATSVLGGSGNATFYGGAGVDYLQGGTGTDVLNAGDGDATLNAGTGNDSLYGGAGPDLLEDTQSGNDLLVAGSDDDSLIGIGNDTLVAGAGDDVLQANSGSVNFEFDPGFGNDTIIANGGTVNLQFGPGILDTDFTGSAVFDSQGNNYLELDGDGGSILIENAFTGSLASAAYLDPSNLPLQTLFNDVLGGDQTVAGANGNLIINVVDGESISAGPTDDTISSWGNDETLTAGSSGTFVYAAGDDDVVDGGIGNDTLEAVGADTTLNGGTANELFVVGNATDVVVGSGVGADTISSSVSYTLPTLVDTLTLTGGANISATGNSDAANLITGNSGNDTLIAGSGADTLVSGTGIDTLQGGRGGDTYVINNSADLIQLESYQSDSVESSVSYALQAAAASLTLTGSGNLTATDDFGYAVITGNAGNDTLIGGSGRDTLVAGNGVDTLAAGTGANTLVLNNAADVIEGASSADTVEASFSYTMNSGIDNLALTGSANLTGTGNDDAANSITANSGVDTLVAGSGSDTLTGNAGDTYVLNSGFGQDEIVQESGNGILQFGAGITAANLALGLTQGSDGNPALLIQDGTSAVTIDDGFGGAISEFEFANGTSLNLAQLVAQGQFTPSTVSGGSGQILLDNTPDESLAGGIGDDTIYAFGANDTIIAGSGNQQLYGENGGDVLGGSTGSDTLYGGAGDETLIGGSGNTVMYGGTGNDIYQLTQGATATIYPSTSAGTDVIYLPTGMTFSEFTSIQDPNGDLVLQSLVDNTSVIVKGFYSSATSDKTWLLADNTEAPQFLGHFVGAENPPASSYTQEMTQLREAYAAKLGATLAAIGQSGGSISDPGNVIIPGTPDENYHFDGETTQNVTVSGGYYMAGSSENDTKTYTTINSSTTETISTPIYTAETTGGTTTYLIPDNNVVNLDGQPTSPIVFVGNSILQTVYNSAGDPIGVNVTVPEQTELVQTGTRTTTITVPTETTVTNETQSFTAMNITGDGGNDTIEAAAPFVGTVNTGNGNVFVNLGAQNTGESLDLDNNGDFAIEGPLFFSPDSSFSPPLGAFIQAGSGIDTIIGTGGADTIAAGTGFDYLDGWMGTTYYVPMTGDSTAVLADDVGASPYGSGQYPQTTLVLPEGVTPQNLQYRIFQDPTANPESYGNSGVDSEVLQLRYGDSTVLVPFDNNISGYYPGDEAPITPGVTQFQFADGTVLSRAELIAQATLLPNDFNPVVNGSGQEPLAGTTVAASTLFSATDSPDDPITWYQVSDDGAGGGQFVLNGTPQANGQTFYVSQNQLSQLTYIAGSAGGTDNIQVSAFDGAIWSAPTTFGVTAQSNGVFQASAEDQLVTGSATGPDTLIGGYGADTLQGISGDDTFVYNAGSGAETIDELGNTPGNNTLQLGSGISESAVTLGESAGGALVLTLDSTGDTVLIQDFNPLDPLNSLSLQNFDFADGSTLNFLQLIADSTATSGTIANADGSTTNYTFNPGSGTLYSAQTTNAQGQLTGSYVLQSDGSVAQSLFAFNADGSYTDTVTTTPSGGSSTSTVYGYDAQGQLQSADTTNPDGSTDDYCYNAQGQILAAYITNADGSSNDSTYAYNSDGSYTDTVVTSPAVGASTTSLYSYDSQGQLQGVDIANPDGSQDDYSYNAQGQILTAYILNADGSSDESSYQYNADGSYTDTVVATASDGSETITAYGYNAQGQLLSADVANPDGSTDDYSYNTQGQILTADITNADGSTNDSSYAYNADGSYTDTVVTTPAGSGAATTTLYGYNAQGQLQSADTQNPDGSTDDYSYNTQGQILSADITNADGSTNDSTYTYNADGSYSDTVITTPAGSTAATTTVYSYNSQGQLQSADTANPGGSTTAYSYNAAGDILTADITNTDGSTNDSTYGYNSDGSYTDTVVITSAAGSATTTVYGYGSQGQLQSADTTNPDGSTDNYDYNTQGQIVTADITNTDGSTNDSTYAYNSDGSYTDRVVTTASGGSATSTVYGYNAQGQLQSADTTNPDGSTDSYGYNDQGQILTADITNADGSTNDSSYTYNTDGSYTDTVVTTPASGGSTTTAYSYNTQGQLLSADTTNPDGSTDDYSYNGAVQIVTAAITNADGSTNDSTYAYNADGSYSDTVVATPAGGGATTTLYSYTSSGQLQSADTTNPDGSVADYSYNGQGQVVNTNDFVPSANGSYTDTWSMSNGAAGEYWWNSSTYEYQETWQNADGSSFTDTYQYAAGGSPGASGYSFTETYSDSSGDTGSRTYDAATGVTTVSWDSAQTGAISGTSANDPGFIGLQLEGEVTNTTNDSTYFNPLASSAFNAFLTAHG